MISLRKLTPLFRLLFASLVLATAVVLLFKGASDPIHAQQSPSAQQERQMENTVPKHVPLDIKVTKEKEKNWKDLKNDNWAQDFELEIKNTGDKPIYTFGLTLYFDVPTDVATESIETISYGRPEISDPKVKPTEEDIPIKPGESKVFKIHPGVVRAWEKGRREKGRRLPTTVRIVFYQMTFGDGTGLMFDKALPYPYRKSSQFFKPGTRQQTALRRETRRSTPSREVGAQTTKTSSTGGLSAGKFLFAHSASTLSRTATEPLESCQSPCEPRTGNLVVKCYGCSAQNDPMYDPAGPCVSLSVTERECTVPETGEPFNCPVVTPIICESEPPPPPPGPTPTPTPTPSCTSCETDEQCGCGGLHCNLNLDFCVGNYYYGCDEHFVDDCLWEGGMVPAGTCDCVWPEDGDDCSHPEAGGCWRDSSPIIVDITGDGFRLTSAAEGVLFDFFGNRKLKKLSWTAIDSDDAWLALDRNANGRIDNALELFGNVTPQSRSTEPNGFLALADFDRPSRGGNADGVIDSHDVVFGWLRLWQDTNHNGFSEPHELKTLNALGVESISLEYLESRRRDQHGNVFRFRAKVYGVDKKDLGRWAYDVFLQTDPPTTPTQKLKAAVEMKDVGDLLRLVGIVIEN
jgi:hypothetical protein